MDIIDKIISKLKKEQAPQDLRARILDIPNAKKSPNFFKAFRIILPAALVVALVLGGFYYYSLRVPKLASAFELVAQDFDAAGISPDGAFILKSSKDISAFQVKKILKFSPEADFSVEESGKNRFIIKPLQKLSGNTIYKVSILEGAAERDYLWAFQVRAPFAIVSSFPRNQATYVPVNSVVEVVFNRDNLENPEKYFQIAPSVQGKFEVHTDKLVFIPQKPFAEKTVYKITFKKGLSAKGLEEILLNDISFSFETSQTSYQAVKDFGFSNGITQFSKDSSEILPISEYNMDFRNSQATVFSFKSREDFVKAFYKSRDWELGWASFYRQSANFTETGNLDKIASFAPQIIQSEYQKYLEIPQKLLPGYYLLEVKAGDLTRQAWMLVNDTSHYYSITNNNGFVWAYKFSEKSPLSGAEIAFYDTLGNRQVLGNTDSSGLSQFDAPEKLKSEKAGSENYGKPKLLEITVPGEVSSLAVINAGWWWPSGDSSQQDFWNYISTDRYTYQLTDSIKFWGIVKGKSQDIRNQKVKVQLRQGYYNYYETAFGFEEQDRPLSQFESVVSPFDTISGQLDFSGLAPGTYEIDVLYNDQVVSRANVEILNYVKPLYKILVTPSKKALFSGEPVDFNVKAQFYDETPVGSLKLKYSGYYADKNYQGEITLDQKGEGKLTLKTEYDRGYKYYPSSLYVSFYPALAEEGEITSESSSSVLVFGPHIYQQSSQKYNGNNNFTVTAKANEIVLDKILNSENRDSGEYIGQPKANLSLAAEIEKTEYIRVDLGTSYDPVNKVAVPNYRYDKNVSVFKNLSGATDSKGEWVFTVDLPKSEMVYYKIKITGTDQDGRLISSEVWPYYYSDFAMYDGTSYGGNSAKPVVIALESEDLKGTYDEGYSVGEKINLTANVLRGANLLNGKTLFYRYGHTGVGNVQIRDGYAFSEDFSQNFKPGVSYRAVVFGPYGFVESNTAMAYFKQDDARLNITIKPDKEKYRPGETAKLEVEVKDRDGKSQNGEINLSVVDEAVFDVLPNYWQREILSSLYQTDYSDPRSGVSDFTPALERQNGGAEGGGCFLGETKILMAGGAYKQIKDIKVGDIVLTRERENDSALAPAIVQGISRHLVGDYLVINGALKATPEHRLYVNGKWLEAGLIKEGDILINESGRQVKVNSVKKVISPETMVYNINVGRYHTYFAGGLFAHNAEKGGGYRSEFVDTAHFETKEISNGKASFEFKLPDNVTSWRATVNAFENRNILAGSEKILLPATLPFFVDAVASQNYLAGDMPSLIIRSFGAEYNKDGQTSFAVDIDGINYHQTKTGGQSVEFALPALPEGNFEIKIKGKQGNLEDGIIRKIGVVKSYFASKEPKLTKITSGLASLSGNQAGYTDVSFTDMGRARFFNELLWNQYQGGKRADQVVASYLAGKFLKEYFGLESGANQLDLSSYHVPDQGIALFTYGDTELAISAKISDLVPDYVYQPQLIEYFKKTMRNDKADIHRIAVSLYGLSALNQPVLAKLQFIKDEPGLTLEDKMYVSLGLAKLGDKETALSLYNSQIKPQLHFEAGQAWFSNIDDQTQRVKLTTLAGALSATLSQDSDALAVWEYSKDHNPQNDLDALERFIILREELNNVSKNEAGFTYELNGEKFEVKLEKGSSKTVKFSEKELSQIKFSKVSGDVAAIAVIETSKDPQSLLKNADLSISRSYWVNGRQAASFNEGDTVVVRLEYTIKPNAIDGGYQVVDFLPSGLKPVSNLWQRGLSYAYDQCYQKGYPLVVEGNKIYFSAYHSRDNKNLCNPTRIEYYARAAAKGEFNANPALLQSLKNYDSLNISESLKVNVK